MNLKFLACLIMICACCSFNFGQIQVKNKSYKASIENNPQNFFPLSELKEGMTGTARTVFRGVKPDDFNVEIIGIVHGAMGPKQSMIIGKISGGNVDRTSVFAGMSGSPVYIDGKLVGAIAYSFPFSKEAICGITPIRQMISIFEKKEITSAKRKKSREISFADIVSANLNPNFPNKTIISASTLKTASEKPSLRKLAEQTFRPIATPVTFSGFSEATLEAFRSQLAQVGLLPVSTIGGSAPLSPLKRADETTLRGGDSLIIQLTRGDYSMFAAGTVTLRNKEKIYAFGHPFLNLGSADLPMAESSVVTVIPSLQNSFKLSVPRSTVGSMKQDRATGVLGKLGAASKMIPVKLNLRTSRNRQKNLNFEVAKDDVLTPFLLNMTVYNSIVANEKRLGNLTIDLKGEVKIKDHDPIYLEHRFSSARAAMSVANKISAPVKVLLESAFDGTEIDKIELHLKLDEGLQAASLEQISVNKTEVRAGKEVEIEAYVRANSGKLFSQKIPIKIPRDTPSGTLMITVGDGNSLQFSSELSKFMPKNLAELINKINKLKRNDRLYVQIHRVTKGVIIGPKELPNLPPSVLATLNSPKMAGTFKPTVRTILKETEIPPAKFIIFGKKKLEIKVIN